MTDAQKQVIARLVADKVWGWIPTDEGAYDDWCAVADGRYWDGFMLLNEVFSWPGFGRTVEAITRKMELGEWQAIDLLHNQMGYLGEGYICKAHLAALDALGIGWKEDK